MYVHVLQAYLCVYVCMLCFVLLLGILQYNTTLLLVDNFYDNVQDGEGVQEVNHLIQEVCYQLIIL